MLWSVACFLLGEVLLLIGLWLAWPPLALIAAGVQLSLIALTRRTAADAPA